MLMWDNGGYRLDFNFVAQVAGASQFWQFGYVRGVAGGNCHGVGGERRWRTIIDDGQSQKPSPGYGINSLLMLVDGVHVGAGGPT